MKQRVNVITFNIVKRLVQYYISMPRQNAISLYTYSITHLLSHIDKKYKLYYPHKTFHLIDYLYQFDQLIILNFVNLLHNMLFKPFIDDHQPKTPGHPFIEKRFYNKTCLVSNLKWVAIKSYLMQFFIFKFHVVSEVLLT